MTYLESLDRDLLQSRFEDRSAHESQMVRLVSERNWDDTLLGPIERWPASLRAATGICLHSWFPMMILWGPELIVIYNDAYGPILGRKHPSALGSPVSDVWPEIWPTIGPMLQSVLRSGVATAGHDLPFSLRRRGFLEDCYFTFSYSPIHVEDGSAGGVFVTVLETTERVVSVRRMKTLTELGARLPLARDRNDVLRSAEDVLRHDPHDVPWAALYVPDTAPGRLDVALHVMTGDGSRQPAALPLHDARHPAAMALRDGQPRNVSFPAAFDIATGFEEAATPLHARVLPLRLSGQTDPSCVLVMAANPRCAFDDASRSFIDLVAAQLATALGNVEAMEAERRRAAALAELDEARSRFFFGASHELRTPLTLILGPLDEVLQDGEGAMTIDARRKLQVVRRNAQHLERLVDSVLDFARIEAGRWTVRRAAVDVGALTRDLASLFESAARSRGLSFSVGMPTRLPTVMLDPDLWERVVLNLLSNALKCTARGGIDVRLAMEDRRLQLEVRDTGCGIDGDELPHIFDRFYRTRSSSRLGIDGTGIGLSLVRELVELEEGRIEAESEPGRGSRFMVSVPLRIAPAAAVPCVRSAIGERTAWFDRPSDEGMARASAPPSEWTDAAVKVLVVDDNLDLTDYLTRVLAETCSVVAVHSAHEALEKARALRPDVLLTDVMMPGMDGFELLEAIRADASLATLSVIMLSARAGDEARRAALEAGVDDYFVKPFNARELVARVQAQVRMVRLRRRAAEREIELLRRMEAVQHDLDGMLEATTDAVAAFDEDLRLLYVNSVAAGVLGEEAARRFGAHPGGASPYRVKGALARALRLAIAERRTTIVEVLQRSSGRWFQVRCHPTHHGVLALAADITQQKRIEALLRDAHAELERRVEARTRELQEADELLAAMFDRAPVGIALLRPDGLHLRANLAYQRLVGRDEPALKRVSMDRIIEVEDFSAKRRLLDQLLGGAREASVMELRYRRPSGDVIWVSTFVSVLRLPGRPAYLLKIVQDITGRKRAESVSVNSQMELRRLYDRLQSAREEERLALAREVHDHLGQLLSAAKIDIKLLEEDLRAGVRFSRRRFADELRSACKTIDQAIDSVRRVAGDLRPPALDESGLCAAIQWHTRDFERRTRLSCSVHLAEGMAELRGERATALFRIYQEALTNIVRHANATQVTVRLMGRGDHAVLSIRDDGIGIAAPARRSGQSLGLRGMQERAALLGGSVRVRAMRGGGTLVVARVPVRAASDAGTNGH